MTISNDKFFERNVQRIKKSWYISQTSSNQSIRMLWVHYAKYNTATLFMFLKEASIITQKRSVKIKWDKKSRKNDNQPEMTQSQWLVDDNKKSLFVNTTTVVSLIHSGAKPIASELYHGIQLLHYNGILIVV